MEKEKILKEINDNRGKFRVDHFDIIISEYVRKNEKKTIILNPPYQRTFRWNVDDQSSLIESILLGIPLPPIYVFQRGDGKWEVIDGLQRTMTIISFFKGDLTLKNLKILKSLNGRSKNDIPDEIMLKIENARIRVELVEETKDIFSQYILFDRLNSNGEKLSAQEKRNFLIYKKNPIFYDQIQSFSKEEYFLNVLGWKKISGKEKDIRIQKQENVEYVLKFFLARSLAFSTEIKKYSGIEEFINLETLNYLSSGKKLKEEYLIFERTFSFLNSKLSDKALMKDGKKSNNISNRFTLTTGLSYIVSKIKDWSPEQLETAINDFFKSETYLKLTKSNYSPTKRIYELNRYSYQFFTNYIVGD